MRLGCLRRPVVLRRRGACLTGGIAVSGRATDIADTARRACRALVRAGRRSVRLSGPIQRLNRVRSRRFDRYSGRRGAFVRCRSPFLAARASCSERCDAARRIVASLTRGLGAHCSRCRCVLSAARDPFHPIPRGDIFGCFHQASLQPRRCSAAKGNHLPRSTEQRHVRSAPRRSPDELNLPVGCRQQRESIRAGVPARIKPVAPARSRPMRKRPDPCWGEPTTGVRPVAPVPRGGRRRSRCQ